MNHQLYEYFYGHGSVNERLFLFINHSVSPLLDAVMPAFTLLGGSNLFPLYFAFLALLWLVRREAMPGSYPAVYFISFCLSLAAEELLKELFHVPRPPVAIGFDKVRVIGHLSRSFALPSGHAIFAFMTATVIGHGRGWRWQVPLFLLTLLVAWSRVYLGVHYPLDVLAGALVGIVCGLLVWKCYEFAGEKFRKRRRNGSPPDAKPEK